MKNLTLLGITIRLVLIFFLMIAGMYAQGCSCSADGYNPDYSTGDDIISDIDGDGIPDNEDDDIDGDGVLNDEDCEEKNATIYPGAPDTPDENFLDANCDGVDGDIENAVWVSADEGDNGNDGTFFEPVKTLAKGIDLAADMDAGFRDVYVVNGTYNEDVLVTDDVNLYGGYSLLEDDERTRDLTTNRAVLNGKDGDKNVTITFHEGPFVMEYTLLVQDTTSTIDGFEIYGDVAGLNVVVINSNASITHNDLYDDEPTAVRPMSLTLVAIIDSATTKDHTITLQDNRIFMEGTGGLGGASDSYTNVGVLAYPAMDAETSLTLMIKDNEFNSSGMTNEALAIVAADDDDDPTDDAATDSKADLSLYIESNTVNMTGLYEAAYGVLAGSNQLGKFKGPSIDNLNFLQSLTMLNNKFYLDMSGSEAALIAGVALVRDTVLIANNTFQIEGTVSIVFPLFNFLAETELLNNTFSINVTSNQVYGPSFWTNDTLAGAAGYVDKSPGRIINNIFSIKAATTSPSCLVAALVEHSSTANDSYVNSASPSVIKNNDIYIDTPCSDFYYYVDADSISSNITVDSILDFNAKTGFRPDDPSEIADNIALDPILFDTASQDLSLGASSPCIDTGLALEDILADITGTLRPQSDGFDIGAYEF
ncbi:DUF1565 domain-containing protein [bacterium]|nr:DUF1565 domain-containing protein [bacterium]